MGLKEVDFKLLDMIDAAVRLAESVADDIKEQRSVSNETVLILNQFSKIHDELSNIIDFENLAPKKGNLQ